jgi:DNA-binding XRE family transcriptional regulator
VADLNLREKPETLTGCSCATDPSEDDRVRAFNQVFCARVRAARQACGITQAEMARRLGVSLASYWKYENRTPLPHHLAGEFVDITGIDLAELYVGVVIF